MQRIIFFISVVVLLFSIQVQVYMYAPITNTYIKRGVCIYLIHSAVILVNDNSVFVCFVFLHRTSSLGDLHHRDEWEKDSVGCGRQHGSC